MTKSKPIKVCLTNQGEDSETPWAEDLGPAPGQRNGARKVRLTNVPFLHAKPTWGDVIIASPREDGFLTWDRGGVAWSEIGTRIAEDGGRWTMIVDYVPHPGATNAFGALARACADRNVVCEGAWGPSDAAPGRAYLALVNELDDTELVAALRAARLPCELVQVHPAPSPVSSPVAGAPAAAVTPTPSAKKLVRSVAKRAGATRATTAKLAVAKPAAAKPAPPSAKKRLVVKKAATKKPVAKKR